MKIVERIKNTRYGKKFLEQYGFKTLVFAVISLIISVAFAVFNGVIAVLESSVWYGALAAYYITLVLFRGGVITANGVCRKKAGEDARRVLEVQNKIHLASGAFLVITGIAMGVAVTQMVMYTPPVTYGEITAISNAAYTFYKITIAIVNLVKAKKRADPVSQSLKSLNLADAAMSMVALTVALLTTFGDGSEGSFMLAMKACVGFAACALVLALATYMIISSAKKLKGEANERERK